MESTVGRMTRRRADRFSAKLLCGASIAALALGASSPAEAEDRYWDANGSNVGAGGTGNWNTSSLFWSETSSDVLGPYWAWNNAALDNAIFAGTAGTVTLTAPITVRNITFNTNGYVLNGGVLTLGGVTPTINTGNGNVTQTINSVIAGTAGLTKSGTGTLFLTGTNTFSGGITIDAGTLRVDDEAALGALSNVINVTANSGFRIDSGDASNRTVTIASGATLTLNAAATGSALYTGAGNLNIASGVVMNNDANTYTGTTRLNGAGQGAGNVVFTSVRNLGEASSLGAPTTVENGTILFAGGSQYTDRITYTGTGDSSNRNWVFVSGPTKRFVNQGSGTLILTGDFDITGSASFESGSAGFDLLGVISGSPSSVAFNASAAGGITLGGANTFSGVAGVAGGIVSASKLSDAGVASSFGTGPQINLGNNGVLRYTGAGDSSNRTWDSNGATAIHNDGTGALALGGDLTFNAAAPAGDRLTFGGSYAGTNIFSGVISGAGDLASSGSSLWELTGANTRTGALLIDGGTLRAGGASAFGTVTGVTVNGGVLDLNGFDLEAPSLNGAGGAIALGSATLTVNNTAANSFAGAITGTGGLIKSGAGALTLTGASTYTGDTTIGGGALNLDFSAAGAPASNILSASTALNMAGGALNLVGTDGVANTQDFGGLNVTAGNSRINATSGAGGAMTVDLGAITRTGGLINFGLPDSGGFTTTNPDGALGGWAMVNNSDYAKVVAGGIIAFDDTDYTDKDEAATWADGEFISDDDGDADGFSGTVTGSVQLAGLRYSMPVATTVTVGGGETLGVDGAIIVAPSVDANDQLITGGSLTGGAGGGALGLLQNSTGNFTIASAIIDNGGATGFTKGGAGQATLSGANTYTGVTTLSGGTLTVSTIGDGGVASGIGASSAASSNLVLESGTLQYDGATATTDRGFTLVNGGAAAPTIEVTDSSADLTFTGLVTSPDDAGLTKTGAGTLTLANGANDYFGATTINGGALSIDTIADGGIVSGIGASSSDAANLVMSGGMLQYTGATAASDRSFTLDAGGGGFDVTGAPTELTLSGTAVGDGSLTKDGAGTLILSGVNTYTGGTIVDDGILRAGSTQAFGAVTSLMTVNAGGILDLNGLNNRVGALAGDGDVALGSAILTLNGANGTFTGTISGTGGVTKNGGGVQTISGCNNDYTGATTISGTLSVNCLADGGLASGVGASDSVSSNLVLIGGRLTYTGASESIDRGFTLQSGNNFINVNDAAATLEFEGVVTGGGALNKEGGGTLVLSGANAYTGNTRVIGSVLRAGTENAFGPQGHMTLDNTAGVLLDLNGHDTTVTSLINGGANGGDIDLGGATLTIDSVDNRSYAGAISGAGDLVMNANNAARVQTLTGCNSSYGGGTIINSGVFAVNCLEDGSVNSSIGASDADATNLVLNGGTLRYIGAGSATDRLFTLGGNFTLEASGTGTVTYTNTAAITQSGSGNRTLTLGGTNTGDNTLAAGIDNPGSGATSMTKSGAGTWILTNPGSTYTGVTSILGGVLGVDKLADGDEASSVGMSSNAASNLVIGNGGTLRYTGAGDTTDRRFTLAAGTTAIQSSGSGAVEFTNTGAISYSGNGARVVSLGGTNTDNNVMGAAIGNQNATNITSLAKNDAGRWILTGDNTYAGSTNINAGTLILGHGGTTGSVASGTINNFGALGFNRSNTLTYGGVIQGSGSVEQFGSGLTILTGANTYSGATTVSAGSLWINGDQSAATGLTSVAAGATLGGIGVIGGDVSIANGGILAPGNSPGVLTINGDLLLDSGSILDFEFGQANVVGGPLNDLIEVGGDLTLDGVINVTVTPGGSFDAGLYRVINYAGTLTENILDPGTMPPGSDVFVQTSIANQVNLVNTAGLDVNLWDGDAGPKFDGTVNGGDGLWQNGGGNDNWADISGFVNLPWIDDAFAIFTATPGTVTVDDSLGAVTASGMQFASDGYLVTGDSVGLVGPQSILRVGDGTLAGLAMTATIASELTGATQIVKTDLGTLLLDGANTFTGGARIEAGVLSVSADVNLGGPAGDISFDGGALQATATFASARDVTLEGDGAFLIDPAATLTLNGLVSGVGGVTKDGAGTLVFASDNTYAGGTTITAGTLQLGDGGTAGALAGDVVNDGVFAFNRSDAFTFGGTISGSGALSQIGVGTTILTAENTYAGGTTISTGTLQLGDGGIGGSIVGDVLNNSLFAFNRSDDVLFDGLISGTGALSHIGAGATILTGANAYAGATNVDAGTLLIDGDQTAATGLTSVAAGATLGGNGVIGGDAAVADGAALAPGSNDVGMLTINGALALNDATLLDYEFGQSDVVGGPLNDLIEVGGDLVLDGVIDVTVSPGGVFDVGLYRVISYGGALTDNTLDLGAMPPGSDVFVQTAIANQVNLVNTVGLDLNFWDGDAGPKFDNAVNGGDGLWQASGGNDNWADLTGALNAAYQDGAFAIFSAAAGIVTVDDSLGALNAAGMQFASDGYVIAGDSIGLIGPQSILRVGDGTAAGLAMTATIESALTGSSQLVKTDLGTLSLAGPNSYTGGTIVDAGTLLVNGDNTGATGLTTVNAGTLGGGGVIGGDVVVGAGTLAPGSNGVGTLTINGGLTLDAASILDFEFGEAGAVGGALNDLVEIGGDLMLNGTINVTEPAGGAFDIGIYRVFNYAGALTDNGLAIGSMPGGSSVFVQTAVANQVNLINVGGLTLSFWDGDDGPKFNGVVDGGDGVWQASGGNDNWTGDDGAFNAPYADGTFAIFSGAAGTVTVDNSLGDVIASGMQFATDGYAIDGDSIFLTGPQAIVRVGDGTTAGENMTATVAAALTGSTELVKTDAGTLILSGANTYTGGTAINGGTVQISSDANLGAANGGLTFEGGAVHTTADITSGRNASIAGGGAFIADAETTLTLGGVISGAGGLTKDGEGSLVLTGDSSGFSGATEVAGGVLVVNGALGGAMNVSGGRLEGGGIVGLATNFAGGVIAPGDSIGVLTINADYVGSGGTLEIEAELGGDASPADRLVVTGATSGATMVSVVNRGGLGAQTDDGIRIVEVGGASDGVFSLDGDYVFEGEQAVVGGAYAYRLYQNGVSTPDDGDWYLRSTYLLEDDPGEPAGPLYQPGVPLYEAYPQLLAALNEAPTLRQRVGGRTWRNGVWGRIEGALDRARSAASVSRTRYDADRWRVEAGVDTALHEGEHGALVGGIAANYARSFADISSVYGIGEVETDAWGLGATLTWHGANGVYADVQGRVNWYDTSLVSHSAGWEVGNDGKGWSMSVEFGRRADIGRGFAVTPQMQYVYSNVDFDRFEDPFDVVVARERGESFKGRFGLELDHRSQWGGAREHEVRGYAIANLKYEFLDDMRVRVGGTGFAPGEESLWGALGLGGEYNWNRRVSLYGEASAETTLNGFGDSRRLTARAGLRAAF